MTLEDALGHEGRQADARSSDGALRGWPVGNAEEGRASGQAGENVQGLEWQVPRSMVSPTPILHR